MISPLVSLVCTLGLLGPTAPATESQPQESPAEPRDVSALFQTILEDHQVPGLAGALIVGESIEALGVLGVRERGKEAKVTLEDRFHLGSLTKSMTATVAAALVEKQRIDWGTTVGEVFGAQLPEIDEAWRLVTLAQLLNHRGGAPAELESSGLSLLHFHALTRP